MSQNITELVSTISSNSTEPPLFTDSDEDDVNTESVRAFYEKTEEKDRICILLAMSIGLQGDLLNNERLEAHVKKGRVQRSSISVRGKVEYNNEILRRGNALEAGKRPRPAQWANAKRLSWLVEHPINCDEKEWVFAKFNSIMDELDKQALEDIVPGTNIRGVDKYKMRLYEAFFFDEFRDQFLKRNDSQHRTQLDARNSEEHRLKPYHEVVCDKYNDESWLPYTKPFPLFHHELSDSFSLPLLQNQKLTYKQTKRLLVEVRGRLNIVSIELLYVLTFELSNIV